MIKFSSINRNAEIRNKASMIADLQKQANSRHLFWHDGQVLMLNRQQHYFDYNQVVAFTDRLSKPIYLGMYDNCEYFAYHVNQWHDSLDLFDLLNLRAAAFHTEEQHLALMFYSQGLLNWHISHQYCAVCGTKTHKTSAGHSRTCSNQACGKEHFPRIEPAVIFSVCNISEQESKILLARQASWDENRYSVLAGFVESGESIEQAVTRECLEEVGLNVFNIHYFASQPWPFPSSLMLGFSCETSQKNINLIDQELEKAQWFSAIDLEQAIQAGSLKLPYSVSISWYLIEHWFHQQTGKSLKSISIQ